MQKQDREKSKRGSGVANIEERKLQLFKTWQRCYHEIRNNCQQRDSRGHCQGYLQHASLPLVPFDNPDHMKYSVKKGSTSNGVSNNGMKRLKQKMKKITLFKRELRRKDSSTLHDNKITSAALRFKVLPKPHAMVIYHKVFRSCLWRYWSLTPERNINKMALVYVKMRRTVKELSLKNVSRHANDALSATAVLFLPNFAFRFHFACAMDCLRHTKSLSIVFW